MLTAIERGKAWVPSIWVYECGNALLVAERRRRLSEVDCAKAIHFLRALPFAVEEIEREAMADLVSSARRRALTVYDAAYLGLAIRKGLPLATKDRRLARAAGRGGVEIFLE